MIVKNFLEKVMEGQSKIILMDRDVTSKKWVRCFVSTMLDEFDV